MKTSLPSACVLLAAASLLLSGLPEAGAATTYTYNGAQTTSGNTWSSTANWSPTGAPGSGDTAVLGNVTSNTTITYDSAASGTVGTITFQQATAGTTLTLDVSRSASTISNALTVSASAGTSQLLLEGGVTLKDSGGITIGPGGLFTYNASAAAGTVNGALTVQSGGTFAISGTSKALTVTGNFTLNGAASGTGSENGLSLQGTTNVISASNTTAFNAVSLTGNGSGGTSTLTSNSRLTGTLSLRSTGNATLNFGSSYSGNYQVSNIALLQQTLGATTTFQLGSDIFTQALAAATFSQGGQGGTGAVGLAVDLNGHTLDFSTYASTYQFAPTDGQNGGNVATAWTISSSTGSGTIRAASFDLSQVAQVGGLGGVAVGANVILNATGTASANNLGYAAGNAAAGWSIDPTSTFLYSGAATSAAPATLVSNQAIGNLKVTAGFLNVNQAALSLGGGVTLAGGGLLLNGTGGAGVLTLAAGQAFAMSGGTLMFDLGTAQDQIVSLGSGAFTITGGKIQLTLGSGFNYASSYDLFSGFSSGSVSGLSIAGYDTADYTAVLGTDGVLTFSALAVPEPSAWVLLALGAAALLGPRRKAARACLLPAVAALALSLPDAGRAEEAARFGFEPGDAEMGFFVPAESTGKKCRFDVVADTPRSGAFCGRLKDEDFARFCVGPKAGVRVSAGSRYRISAWMRAGEGTEVLPGQPGFLIRFEVPPDAASGASAPSLLHILPGNAAARDFVPPAEAAPLPRTWTKVEAVVQAPPGGGTLSPQFFVWYAKGEIFVDDFCVEKVPDETPLTPVAEKPSA